MGIATFDRNIGIVGLAWSGKTVFLTSLLAHLQHHDVTRFPLKMGKSGIPAEIIKFKEETLAEGVEPFPHEVFRDLLVHHGDWPRKSTDTSQFRCIFERTDWSLSDVALTFLDFPGERFADCVMLDDDFARWSDLVIKRIEADLNYRQLAGEFLRLQEKDAIDADNIVFEYKKAMSRFALNYRPLITPSVFALDQHGRTFEMMEPQEMAKCRLSGLSEDAQFAPLGSRVRSKQADLADTFEKRYRAYRQEIPEKVFKQLANCHRLIVLVDIPNILAGNIGRLNDAETIVENILACCVRERGLLSKVGMFLSSFTLPNSWRPKGITRIAFVATKADMIQPNQGDKLLSLLRALVRKKIRNYKVRHEYFTCSAITSTYVKDGALLGHPVYTKDLKVTPIPKQDDPLVALSPSDLPDDWPLYWKESDFCFPEVWPRVPNRKSDPPHQVGLNRIFDYLLEEDFLE